MPLRDDLLNPISGSNPSGENLRYAPVYDQLKEARREDDEAAQGEWRHELKKADWVLVVKLAGETLAKKSKDLQIAAWLTEGLLRREGYGGLKAGLDLSRGLLENFWDTLYPEIEDGDLEMRATPVEWIGSRLDEAVRRVPLTRGGIDWFRYKESRSVSSEADAAGNDSKLNARTTAIEEGKLTPEQFDQDFHATPEAFYLQATADLDGCLESLEALNGVSEEKFTEYAPNLGGLRKTLEEVKQAIHILLVRKREQESGAETSAAAGEAAAEGGFEPAAAAAGGGAAQRRAGKRPPGAEPADRDDALDRVAAVVRWLRQQDASNPAPYLLLRGLRWGELRAAGEGYDPDPSLLEPPPAGARQELKRLAGEGDWAQVLEAAETAMESPGGRAWLDLQRYAVNACDNLGYYAAAWAIKSELRALLADVPKLLEQTLADDTPTANAETRAWVKEFAGSAGAAPAESFYAPPPRAEPAGGEESLGAEAPPDAYELAMAAARSGRPQEAVEILSREAAQESSGRGRFQRKVQLAQVCLAAGRETLALPILQELAQEMDRRGLEGWEPPEALAHALGLLYRCMEKTGLSTEEKQKVYGRICRLDAMQALALAR